MVIFPRLMTASVQNTHTKLKTRTLVYALGIYINPGMRKLLLEYLKRQAPNFREIHVIFCYWWPGIDREPFVDAVNSLGISNLKAHEFAIMASPAFGKKLGWPGANWPNALKTTFAEIKKLSRFLKDIKADFIHIILTEYQANFAFARAAKIARVPVRLLSFTGIAPTPAKFRSFINGITNRYLTGVLLASSADSDGASILFPNTPQAVIHGWGLAPDLFKLEKVNPKRIRDELGLSDNDLLIGTTTRIAPRKGQDTLIKSLPKVIEQFPRLTCAILGGRYDPDQAEKGLLEKLATDLGVAKNVRFLGERDDAPDIFAAYDVAVHLADFDYLPFGVLECMALGKPCLCTDVGGIPDVIKHGQTGLLIKPGDTESASEILINLLTNPSERQRLGDSARELVLNRYNLDHAVESLKEMYSDTLEGRLKGEYGG
jgi:glycosyltransferase involved in cell wall biosynthesis